MTALEGRFRAGAERGELRAGLEPSQATRLFLTGVFGYLISRAGSEQETCRDLDLLTSLYLAEPAAS